MTNLALVKEELRFFFKKKIKEISLTRRKEVQDKLIFEFWPLLETFPSILSFASRKEEIDLWEINTRLAKQDRLILPRVEGDNLKLFKINNLDNDLCVSIWGIKEPDPKKCPLIDSQKIHLAIVPGLVFDAKGHRLGYGNGYYDRLLGSMPYVPTWGIGYKEQLSQDLLPVALHDISVKKFFLF